MLRIIKQKNKEPAYQCGYCNTVWKNSWLESNRLNGTCPYCEKEYDLSSAYTIKLKPEKRKYKIPKIVRLRLSLNKLESILKEKQNNIHQLPEMYDNEHYMNQINNIRSGIDKLKLKVENLKQYAINNELNINDIYN